MDTKIDLSIKSSVPPVEGFAASNLSEMEKRILLATRAQKKINELEKFKETAKASYSARVDEEIDPQIKRLEDEREFFEKGIAPYFEAQLKGSRNKSVKLPSGTIKKSPATTVFYLRDGTKLSSSSVDWAKANGFDAFVVTKTKVSESLDAKSLRKEFVINDDGSCSRNGTPVPGVTAVYEEGKVVVKLND